jgi:hypothetical protein
MDEDSETGSIVYLFRKGGPNNLAALGDLEQYGVTWKNSGHYRKVTFPKGSTKQQGMSADTEFGLTHVTLPNGLVLNLSTFFEDRKLIVHHFNVQESQDLEPQVFQILRNQDGSGGLAE